MFASFYFFFSKIETDRLTDDKSTKPGAVTVTRAVADARRIGLTRLNVALTLPSTASTRSLPIDFFCGSSSSLTPLKRPIL